ncbi:hypothetical protein V8C86DRAFT_2449250, partial [Haematococcus lacustris]
MSRVKAQQEGPLLALALLLLLTHSPLPPPRNAPLPLLPPQPLPLPHPLARTPPALRCPSPLPPPHLPLSTPPPPPPPSQLPLTLPANTRQAEGADPVRRPSTWVARGGPPPPPLPLPCWRSSCSSGCSAALACPPWRAAAPQEQRVPLPLPPPPVPSMQPAQAGSHSPPPAALRPNHSEHSTGSAASQPVPDAPLGCAVISPLPSRSASRSANHSLSSSHASLSPSALRLSRDCRSAGSATQGGGPQPLSHRQSKDAH